ncbi:hypothetical protein [Leeuwenhoekiella sp. NPDC079379]|uniref:hypothetical protein n=1 Tax=Leeuwenhoekiella sp. NPDC079379 TaxID=3364122 RepID=UPI0037C666C1
MTSQNSTQNELSRLYGIKFISSKYFDTYQNLAINSKNIFLRKLFKNLYTCKADFVKSIEEVIDDSRIKGNLSDELLPIPDNFKEMMPEIGFSDIIKNCHQIEIAIQESCKAEYSQSKNQLVKNVLYDFIEKHNKFICELKSIDFNSLAITN